MFRDLNRVIHLRVPKILAPNLPESLALAQTSSVLEEGEMLGMHKAHQVKLLLKAGHSRLEVAKLTAIGQLDRQGR